MKSVQKSIVYIGIPLILLLLLAACSGGSSPASTPEPAAEVEVESEESEDQEAEHEHEDEEAEHEHEEEGKDTEREEAEHEEDKDKDTDVAEDMTESIVLTLAKSEELGGYLTDAAGMSLYTFARDVPGTSNCYDRCAGAWPPLFAGEGVELTAGDGVPGVLGTTEREDGTVQVTYNDWPLYYWVNDEAPGDTTGHNVGNVWAVAYPETHVFLGGDDELGQYLVGPEGMTLYRFNPDEPGSSNCYDQCAANWPPLLIDEGENPGGNAGVVGDLGVTERDDGTHQITYQGMPLYYWINDQEPGDTTGHGVNNVWYVVPPYTVRLGSSDDLGDFLVGANGMTLYLFTVDEEDLSNCYDQCATNWPPLLVQAGEVPVPGAGVSGELGITERDDETLQVTYDGMPLYFWINDQAPGDTTGHGVNDVWFVVEP